MRWSLAPAAETSDEFFHDPLHFPVASFLGKFYYRSLRWVRRQLSRAGGWPPAKDAAQPKEPNE